MNLIKFLFGLYERYLLVVIGALWFAGIAGYIYAWIKTRTYPFQLSDCELFDKAFKQDKK